VFRGFLAAIILVILSVTSRADNKPAFQDIFGFEIELTNFLIDKVSDGDEVRDRTARTYQKQFKQKLKEACPNCLVESVRARYGVTAFKVTVPHLNNFSFTINLDPATIEIQTQPARFSELANYASELQRLIYDTGVQSELYPTFEGANHIHISVQKAFGTDVVKFRNFIVDLANHPELATGVFEYDHNNAPPMSALKPEQFEAFKNIIAEFDRDPSQYTIKTLAQRIVSEVYTGNVSGWRPYQKYQAFSLSRILKDKLEPHQWTIEIRSIRAPSNFKELLLFLELIQRRLNFVRSKKNLIPVKSQLPSADLTSSQATYYFRKYIAEMGLSWKKYNQILIERDPTVNPWASDRSYFKTLRNQIKSCLILGASDQ